ncbi:MAG: rRNA processing protein RimM [Betaproteobacteria bacterium]|nr:rRNA processing protein RimM [Betaproteobacteria bacterium]
MVVMGRVTVPFGVKGWFKVYTLTAQPENLCDYPNWWLQGDGEWREVQVVGAKVQGATLVARLAGVESREAAAALRGLNIGVPREQLPKPTSGEFYWADLIGLRVVDTKQQELGRVVRMIETGANDVLVVKGEERPEELLIPFIADAILQVDVAAGVIAVDWGRDY